MGLAARVGAVFLGMIMAGCSGAGSAPAPASSVATPQPGKPASPVKPNTPEFYTQNVKPIFDANCARCHGGMNHRGGLNIDTRAGLLKGGHDGAVVVPGDGPNSLLVRLIRHEGPKDDPMPMPPKRKISDADIATVTAWINAGAIMPPDAPK